MRYEPKHCQIVEGSLLDAETDFMVHQTNCMSKGEAAGIARVIFDRFPYADSYSRRSKLRPPLLGQMPGDIEVMPSGGVDPTVVNLYGQFYPGGPPDVADEIDHPLNRLMFFRKGLEQLTRVVGRLAVAKVEAVVSVAFPWRIGCGIAGGDWECHYGPAIDGFALGLNAHFASRVFIYRLPGEE